MYDKSQICGPHIGSEVLEGADSAPCGGVPDLVIASSLSMEQPDLLFSPLTQPMCTMVPPIPTRNHSRPSSEQTSVPSITINADIEVNNGDFTLISSDDVSFTVPSYHLFAAR